MSEHSSTGGFLSVEQLKTAVADGSVDTVIVAITDMQGRLQGKRAHRSFRSGPLRASEYTQLQQLVSAA